MAAQQLVSIILYHVANVNHLVSKRVGEKTAEPNPAEHRLFPGNQ